MEKSSQSQCNERVTFVLLIKSIMDQIDEIAALMRSGNTANLSRHLLAEACSILNELSPEQQARYFETLLTLCESFGTSSIRSVSDEYVESVADAKRRFLTTIRNRLNIAVGE
jgi:hypothetical protein